MSKIFFVNLGDLSLPPFQAHRDISPEHIKEISDSIKLLGVIEPLIVRRTDEGLEIVAGCVRYQAALLAGLKAVPCIITNLDLKASEILKLHENVKRIPLDHVDQGHTFLNMMVTFAMTEKDISECSGKSITYISQHISLVRLDNELTRAVKEGSISFSQARQLMRLGDSYERNRLLHTCQNSGATVQVLRGWVDDELRKLNILPPAADSSPVDISKNNGQHIQYICEACDNPIKTSEIMQVIYCPTCHKALKDAISEEKKNNPSNLPPDASQDAPG
ncbi:Nucleoid occlusion protein [subsurface metagenome]